MFIEQRTRSLHDVPSKKSTRSFPGTTIERGFNFLLIVLRLHLHFRTPIPVSQNIPLDSQLHVRRGVPISYRVMMHVHGNRSRTGTTIQLSETRRSFSALFYGSKLRATLNQPPRQMVRHRRRQRLEQPRLHRGSHRGHRHRLLAYRWLVRHLESRISAEHQ